MGKSRTTKKKRVAELLLNRYPNKFTTDYEENKKLVDEFTVIPSKHLKNEIAGFITSFMNKT